MLVKCICTNCAGHLEFEEENAGQKIECPHCGFDTVLFLPGAEPGTSVVSGLIRRRVLLRRLLIWGGPAVILAALGWALYKWALPVVEDLLPPDATKLMAILVLGLFCFLIPLLFTWLLLPLFLFFQFRKFGGLLAQIEENLRPGSSETFTEIDSEPDVTDSEEATTLS